MEQREFTPEELAGFSGRDGAPVYVAVGKIVYDVSDSIFWETGSHQDLHEAGGDLSEEILDAPHGEDMLESFPRVGTLRKE